MQVCPDLGHLVGLRGLFPEAEIHGPDDVAIAGCACDSRRVRQGELFAALVGHRHDGHDFIAEAVARGCAAVLTDRPLPEASVPVCVVPNARESYARLCQTLAGSPSRQLKLIGVTGTNGKTTTSCLIAGVLRAAGHRAGIVGTLGYLDGRIVEKATHATPPPDRLAPLLARMVRNDCSYGVMEISSHALKQSRVAGVEFDAVCVTNITQTKKGTGPICRNGPEGAAHKLDLSPFSSDCRRTTGDIFDHLGQDGFAVLNADDPGSAGYLRRLACPVLSVGIDSPAEITATLLEQCLSEQTFLLTAGSQSVPVRTPMIGRRHIYNCLVAAAVGLAYDIELTTVVRGLEFAGHVPGRLERIECGQPFGVFVDYARTPDALARVLKTLRDVTAGRLICVFGAGGERDRGKRPLMGRAVEQGADVVILTNDDPRREDPLRIFRDVLGGVQKPRAVAAISDRTAAIRRALSAAGPGDCVLIAGKGHETHQIIGKQRVPLDDRKAAREWLYGGQWIAN